MNTTEPPVQPAATAGAAPRRSAAVPIAMIGCGCLSILLSFALLAFYLVARFANEAMAQ